MAETSGTVTFSRPAGLSLTVPDFYRGVPERESPQVPLVVAIGAEDDPGGFQPTIAVQIDAATPALATVEQLSVATVTRQLALGRHVVAVDVWPVEGQDDGRRVLSLFPDGEDTILELQYLTVRAGRCITLSVLVLASAHGFGLEMFGLVTGTLRSEGPASHVEPQPGSMPQMDPFASATGTSFESLDDIRSRQPFTGFGPRLGPEDIKALRSSRRRARLGREALVAAELVDGAGQLTGSGSMARDLLVRAKAQLLAQVTVPGTDRPYVLEALLGGSEVAVLADSPPGGADLGVPGKTLEVIPALTLGVTLIRWLGLAPAWSVDPAAPPDREVTIARALWQARLTDPHASAPRGATASFLRLWEQPWEVATVGTTKRWRNGPGSLQYLSTPEVGCVVVIPDAHGRFVRLESRPTAQLLHALLVVAGIVDRREPQSGTTAP